MYLTIKGIIYVYIAFKISNLKILKVYLVFPRLELFPEFGLFLFQSFQVVGFVAPIEFVQERFPPIVAMMPAHEKAMVVV